MRNHLMITLLLALLLPATSLSADEGKIAELYESHQVSRIAFGSCLKDPSGAAILDKIVDYKPDLFVWLGDNVYVDTMDNPQKFEELYGMLAANTRFQKLRETCPQLALWDDHDYGADNQGKTYPLKEESKVAFGKFWQLPKASPIWSRAGIYRTVEYGKPGKRVQMIMLDGRWHLDQQHPEAADSYLGKDQWDWLEKVLKRPADVRVICSGVQVVKLNAMGKNWEMWGDHPSERKRLFDLIESARADGVIFISGDMHFAEIYKTTDTAYPLHDITASGLDQVYPNAGKAQPGPEQIGTTLLNAFNFGGILIDWEKSELQLEIRNGEGELYLRHAVPLGDLKHTAAKQ